MKQYFAGTLVLLVTLFANIIHADPIICFGPQTFPRAHAEPTSQTAQFTASAGPATIRLFNGNADGGRRIDSGAVLLNGVPVFADPDFGSGSGALTADIVLEPQNTLVVQFDEASGNGGGNGGYPDLVPGSGFNRMMVSLCQGFGHLRPGSCFDDPHSPPPPPDHVVIAIFQNGMPPAVSLSAVPERILAGQPAILHWTSSAALSLTLSPDIGPVAPSGSRVVHPSTTTTYTIEARGTEGTASARVVINVEPAALKVRFLQPVDGSRTTARTLTVSGTVTPGAGVTVNGIPALVADGIFLVENMELTAGANTLKAVATVGDQQVMHQVVVHASGIDLEPVHLELSAFNLDHRTLKASGVLRVSIANHGTGDLTGPFHVALFEAADPDRHFDPASDNLLAQWTVDAGPAPGGIMDVDIAFQGQSLFRDNRLYVYVDSHNVIEETDKSNNQAFLARPGIDISASYLRVDNSRCPGEALLTVRIGNAGAVEIAAGLPVSFYDGDPHAAGTLIGTTFSASVLSPGSYEDVELAWPAASGLGPVFAVADDDGNGRRIYSEIDVENNYTHATTPICSDAQAVPNTISGLAIDAMTGAAIDGARINLHVDADGVPGALVQQFTTNADGGFLFSELMPGAYLICGELEGYIDSRQNVILDADPIAIQRNLALCPLLGPDDIRIVLTWNEHPQDLDAHMTGPNPDGCRSHCNYWNREITGAVLNLDATQGFGPETMTLTKGAAGTFRYYVHDFTNRNSRSAALSNSGARVVIYFGSGLAPMTFDVPPLVGNVWHVFQIDGHTGQVTPVDRMTIQSEPGKIDFPVITSTPITTVTGADAYAYAVTAEDPDNDPLTFALFEAPTGMTIDPHSGQIHWNPDTWQSGTHKITVQVGDDRCGQDTQSYALTFSLRPAATFSATPCSAFNPGGRIKLTWSTQRADTVSIDQGIGEIAPHGSLMLDSPTSPTTYTLTAVNAFGRNTARVPELPMVEINAGTFEHSKVLEWNTSCAVHCSLSPDIGEVPCSGTLSLDAADPEEYTLIALNAAGETRQKASQCGPPSIMFSTEPVCSWAPGDPVILKTKSIPPSGKPACPVFCRIDQGVGIVPCNESITVWPAEPAIYTLEAFDSSGGAVPVINPSLALPVVMDPMVTRFAAMPTAIQPGDSVTLRWGSKCAQSCFIEPDIGEVNPEGALVVTPDTLPKTYTLSTGPGGDSPPRSVTINHTRPNISFYANPAMIKPGEPATLLWAVDHAASWRIDPDIGPVAAAGSLEVQPSKQTTYTLTAEGPGGRQSRTATVSFIRPTVHITADPPMFHPGQSTTLTWIFTDADTCTIDHGIGDVPLGGSLVVTPERSTKYTITATGPGGSAKSSVTVGCIEPAIEFSPALQTIQQGQTATLTWDVPSAQTVHIHPLGIMPASGSIAVSPSKTTEYALTTAACGTTAAARTTVRVICPPSLSFIEPNGIDDTANTSFLLKWKIIGCDTQTRTSLYYALAPGGAERTLIASDLPNNAHNGIDQYLWDTSLLPEARYYIHAVAEDTHHAPLTVHAGHPVVIDHSVSPVPRITLAARDGQAGSDFGASVAMSDRYAVVGAPYHDDNGAVYIFEREGRDWEEAAKLVCPQDRVCRSFGSSVAIDGETIIVGAEGWGREEDQDAAYVFILQDNRWIEQATLLPENGQTGVLFGTSVALAGDTAFIGAPGSNAVYPFTKQGDAWTGQPRLAPYQNTYWPSFGHHLSLDGPSLAVGTQAIDPPYGDGLDARVYIYRFEEGHWRAEYVLKESDPPEPFQGFFAVHQKNNAVIAGNPRAADKHGAAYILGRDGSDSDSGPWVEIARLTANDAVRGSGFGTSVLIDGDHAYVGTGYSDYHSQSSGDAVYFFKQKGGIWNEQLKVGMDDNTRKAGFGENLALSNGRLLVGARHGLRDDSPTGLAHILITCAADLEVNRPVIAPGATATLSWSTELADTCHIEPDIGSVDPNGSVSVAPAETTTYTLHASGPYGRTIRQITLHVADATAEVTLTAMPATITSGQTATLSWDAPNADEVIIEPDIGPVASTGSMSVTPQRTTTYTIIAIGSGGTSTESVTVTVIDQPEPTAHIEADPGAINTGQSTVLTWSTTHADNVTINPGIGPVAPSGTIALSPNATTTYTLTATGPHGTTTESVTVVITSGEHISVAITSPGTGETIQKPFTTVEGTFFNHRGLETGITVNGVVAAVYEDVFIANGIDLEPGYNTLTIVATDTEGNTASTSVTVERDPDHAYIRLTASPVSGISPLEATLKISGSFIVDDSVTYEISGHSITYGGQGTVDTSETAPGEYLLRITGEGIYIFTAEVEDMEGNTYTDTVAILVLDGNQLDSLLQGKWSAMKAALGSRNIEGALNYFEEGMQELYHEIYAALHDDLPRMVSAMQDIELIEIGESHARYRILKKENHGGQALSTTYYIYFIKNNQGIWRIYRY